MLGEDCCQQYFRIQVTFEFTKVLISPQPDLLPDVFCLMVRMLRLMLVLFIYINSTNIPPIMIINRICENQNLLSLQLISFLVGLRTYQHPCKMCNRMQEILSKLQTVVQISKKEKPFPHSEVQSFRVGLLGFPKLFRAICYNSRWMKLNTVYSQLAIFALT